MATIAAGAGEMRESTKILERCRVVDVALTTITDGDTYSIGPNLVTAAFIETGALETGEVGMLIDKDARTITFDETGGNKSGTLRLFYGRV